MIPNFSFVIPDKLAGSGHPGWGEGLRGALDEMTSLYKITAVLTLTESPLPKNLLKEFDIRPHHLPIRDFGTPDIGRMTEAIAFAREEMADGGRVAVHCLGGYGRTGSLLACLLVSENNDSPQAAIQTIRRQRPGSIETPGQERLVEKWARAAAESRKEKGKE